MWNILQTWRMELLAVDKLPISLISCGSSLLCKWYAKHIFQYVEWFLKNQPHSGSFKSGFLICSSLIKKKKKKICFEFCPFYVPHQRPTFNIYTMISLHLRSQPGDIYGTHYYVKILAMAWSIFLYHCVFSLSIHMGNAWRPNSPYGGHCATGYHHMILLQRIRCLSNLFLPKNDWKTTWTLIVWQCDFFTCIFLYLLHWLRYNIKVTLRDVFLQI